MRFSIRTLLLAIMGVLNLLIAVPVGVMMYKAVAEYGQAQQIRHVTEVINLLYQAKKNLSRERAAALSILFVSHDSFEALNIELQESRKESNSSLRMALAFLENRPGPRLGPVLEETKRYHAALLTLRRTLDIALEKPKDRRDFSLADEYFSEVTTLIEKIDAAIEEYSRDSAEFNLVIARQMRFVRLIWDISEYAGREYAVLGNLIARDRFPTVETQRELSVWRNRIQYGLELAHASVRNNRWGEEIAPYMETAETHYSMIFEHIKDIFYQPTSAPVASILPISVEMWLELASQAVNSLHGMTDAALKVNESYVQKIQKDAERSILVSILFLASVLALSVCTWWLITARVIRPVNSMVNALYGETRQSHLYIPENDNPDEIAKLEQVLKVFQENSRQLQQERDKAQAANIAKGEFLANMSHEIRTPMNVVVGLSNILARTGPLSEKQEEFIKTLQISAESLLSLINDLLDFSKIEASSLELEKIPFSMARLIEDLVHVKSFKAGQKGLVFETDIDDFGESRYIGDPTRIRQVLVNLCGNALKFTNAGNIRLRIKREAGAELGYENIRIVVSDTGIGIPPEKMESVFEKFTQADASITRKYGGTGLGLAITRSLVEMMKGEITVESRVGEGTVFNVCLPLPVKSREELAAGDQPQEPAQLSGREENLRILLVEDYRPNALIAGSFLEEFGYRYDIAENGQQALQKIMENPYAAILMDVQMPGMDGYEATRAIRRYENEQGVCGVKIIGLTTRGSAGDKEKCLAAGMNDYLAKPFDPEKLKQKLCA